MSFLKKLLDRPIAYHRILAEISGSVTAGVMLSQAIYWADKGSIHQDGKVWFYKTRAEWFEETFLKRDEQETARKKLRAIGVLEEKLTGVPAKLYYHVNFSVLEEIIFQQSSMRESNQPVGGNPTNCMEGIPPTITENTTETTTDIKDITPLPKKVTNKSDGKLDLSRFQEQPSEEVWKDFIIHRKNLRAKLTQTAVNALAKQVNIANQHGYTTDDVLSQIQVNGWRGFKFEWLQKQDRINPSSKSVVENYSSSSEPEGFQ